MINISMSDKFKDILEEIKSSRSILKAYAPSKGEEVEISPLTLAQQKLIIETSSDNTLGVLFFNNIFYKILKENVSGDIKQFNTIDRVNLTLVLRQHLKNVINVDESDIDLSGILKRNSSIEYDIKPETIKTGDFILSVEAPDLNIDNFINTHLLNKYKSTTFDENKLKNLISDLYACEILKFIKKIQINDKEVDLHTELSQSLKLIESIDGVHFQPVTEYINKVRELEARFANDPVSEKGIDITPELFIL